MATLLVYLPALRNAFVDWDDDMYIFANPYLKAPALDFFKWAFSTIRTGCWHPLTWISYSLDYAVWGLNPLGYHLTNIILHAVNTFMVVLLATKLLDAFKERAIANEQSPFLNERSILIAAGTAGLLFGLHPLHVESAAWVAERKDLLCSLFFLLSIITYTNFINDAESGPIKNDAATRYFQKRYLATLGFFILALLSKPMAVSLPIVLLLLDWFPFNRIRSGRTFWTACVEKLPFIVLSLALSIVTILAQRAEGAMTLMDVVPLSTRLLVAAESLIAYLWKMIAPVNLVPYYPYPQSISFLSLKDLSAIALVIGITAACMVTAKKQKLWLTVWGYYIVTLIPVLGIVQVGGQAMADRYTYLPSLGPFFIIGLAAAWVWRTVNALKRPGLLVKIACSAALIIVFVSLSFSTFKQIGIWKNSVTLWSYVIEKEHDGVPIAYTYRGVAFERGGQFDKAIEDYERAIALSPSYYKAYNNMGALYGKMSLFARAIEYFNKAIAIAPNYADAYYNRGITYVLIDQFGRALEDFNKAILLNPNDATAYVERGNLHLRMGNRDLAIADFQTACDLGYERGCNALREHHDISYRANLLCCR
jgi:tetratricopeptide (TPR) repeat protein